MLARLTSCTYLSSHYICVQFAYVFQFPFYSLTNTVCCILRRMHCSAGDPKAPSNTRRNQRRGRGSGGGLDGGDEASTSFAKERMRKRMGVNGVVVFLTALLPSLVAGQSMTCGRSKPLGSGYPYGSGYHSFVTPSTETMAKFSALAYNTATFREGVSPSQSPPHLFHFLILFLTTRVSHSWCAICTVLGTCVLVLAACFSTPPLSPTYSFALHLFSTFFFLFSPLTFQRVLFGNGPFLPAAIHRMLGACVRARSRGFACTMPTHVLCCEQNGYVSIINVVFICAIKCAWQ